jgi:hypothetical protein
MTWRFGTWIRCGRWWVNGVAPWQIVPVIAGGMDPSYTQTHFRFRNDDGTEVTATWIAAEDTDITCGPGQDVEMDTVFRLRIQTDETANVDGAADQWFVRRSHNAGSYVAIFANTSVVDTEASAHVSDGDATTAQLTAPTGNFQAGEITIGGVDNHTKAKDEYSELEISMQVDSADVADTDTIDFRVYRDSTTPTALDAYTVTARITIVDPPAGGGHVGWMGMTGVGI